MKECIGSISFKIDTKQLEKIMEAGQLQTFIETATALFKQDLTIELVKNRAASGTTSFFALADDRYGTGPWPPIPLVDMDMRMRAMEKANLEERMIAVEKKLGM